MRPSVLRRTSTTPSPSVCVTSAARHSTFTACPTPTGRKSTSGYVIFLAKAAIAWLSKRQVSIAMSSTEAELMAASLAALEFVFICNLLADLGFVQDRPPVLMVDNKGVVDMSEDYVSNNRTKHIERRHLKIRELVEQGIIKVTHVAGEDNIADILTKPLGRRRFEKLRKELLNTE